MNAPWQKGSVGSYSCPAKHSGRHLKKNSFKKGTAFEFNTCGLISFSPLRFLIHFETSTWQWHLKNHSLKWGTIIKHGTCELILFLPQIPNTLWDLNLARTPGIRSAYITNMVTTLHQITRCPSLPKIKSSTITFRSIKIMSDWRRGTGAMIY